MQPEDKAAAVVEAWGFRSFLCYGTCSRQPRAFRLVASTRAYETYVCTVCNQMRRICKSTRWKRELGNE